MAVTLRSTSFVLRPFRRGDETSLRKNINNRTIYLYTLLIPYPYTAKHASDWIQKTISLQKKKKASEINFAIDIGGDVVRGIGLSHIEKHKAEIGYWLGEKYWGRGIMTAAVKLVTSFCFRKLKLRRIYATVYPHNKASVRVLQKTGFRFEGLMRKLYKKDGKFLDALMYAKVW